MSKDGVPGKAQYATLLHAYRVDPGDHKGNAEKAGLSPVVGYRVWEGGYAARYPWCVSIRDILAGKADIPLDVIGGTKRIRLAGATDRQNMREKTRELSLPVSTQDIESLCADLAAPIESAPDRKRLQNELLAVNRRITALRASALAESALRVPKLLQLLHNKAEEFLGTPGLMLDAEGLAMVSGFAVNIARIHQAFASQVEDVVKAERALNPRDDLAEAAKEIPPAEAESRAKAHLAKWGKVLNRGDGTANG